MLHQPDDPLQFMIDTLKKDTKVKVRPQRQRDGPGSPLAGPVGL